MARKKSTKKPRTRSDTSTKAKKTAVRKRKTKAWKVPRTRNAGTLTEAEYFQKIRNALRKAFRFWKPMVDALEKTKRPNQSKNKLLKWEYQCKSCDAWFPRTGVEIDHVVECGQLNKLEDIPGFIERMTNENISAYQVLCKNCHNNKTQEFKRQLKLKKDAKSTD